MARKMKTEKHIQHYRARTSKKGLRETRQIYVFASQPKCPVFIALSSLGNYREMARGCITSFRGINQMFLKVTFCHLFNYELSCQIFTYFTRVENVKAVN